MQDFMKQQGDWLKTWQQNQTALTKQYAELSQEWLENVSGAKKKQPDFFEGWFKSQGDLEEQFKAFGVRMNEMLASLMGNKMPADMLKFVNMSFFEAYYKHWLSNMELPGGIKNPLGMDGGWQQTANFLRSFMETENPFFSSFGGAKITEQLNEVLGILQGTFGQNGNAFGQFLSGYRDYFGKLVEPGTAQGTEKLAEGFDAWVKEMEKHLSAPKLGINRELVHDISQTLVMSKDYFQAFSKMARLVEATSRKAGIRFQTRLSESALKTERVQKFSEICALWATENETVFLEVMGSEEFAKLQGEFVDAGHRLKIQWNKLAEKALEQTPIALNRDLDLAIKEIHQMKREMKAFQRALKEQQNEVRTVREAQTAVEKELSKAQAAEAAAREEAKKAKHAEAAAREEVKKLKLQAVSVKEAVKQAKAADKAVKASTRATTKTKSNDA